MTAVIQRVFSAEVEADGVLSGRIGEGLYVLLGVLREDGEEDAALLAEKIAKLRIFSDEEGKMNRSVADIGGSIMVVSNFTLAAAYAHGNRPDFLAAEAPGRANALYEFFVGYLRGKGLPVETGRFGADMRTALETNGPVTIVMYSDKLKKRKGEPS